MAITLRSTKGSALTYAEMDGNLQELDSGKVSYTALATDAGAGYVGYKHSATGAVARTQASKNEETYSVADAGAVLDGIEDDTDSFQAALDSGANEILLTADTVVTSLNITRSLVLRGIGMPTIKAKSGSSGSPLILGITSTSNVTVIGIKFDGNLSGVSSFNNVVQSYNSDNVRFSGCRWVNCKGIALLVSGGHNVGISDDCEFNDCGIYHLTSLSSADRRQAFACTGVDSPYSDGSVFNNIGLDCISFATSTGSARATNNKIKTGYAGSIYASDAESVIISNNIISNGSQGGNGIDVHECSDVTIDGNLCIGNGASGILVADSNHISVVGNICKNNWAGGTSAHRGGITLSSTYPGSVSNVTITGNTCYDDQGASVTQKYAIGIYTTGGGTYSGIRVDESNNLKGYTAAGVEDVTAIFQSGELGLVGYQYGINLADMAETTLYTASGRYGAFSIFQTSASSYAEFFARLNNNALKIVDVSAAYELTDTGTTQAVYRDVATNTVRLKNRTGSTKTYILTPISMSNYL